MNAPPPIRILHLRSSPFFGSPEKMILARIKLLPAYDFQYAIAIFNEQSHAQNDFHQKSQALGVATLLLDTSMKRFAENVTRLNRYVRDKGVHLVCAHDFKSNFYAFFIRMMSGIPAVSVFHGRTMKDLKIRLYYLLDALIMSQMDTVICVAESQRSTLRRLLAENKIKIIPNAVDIEEISRLAGETATGVPPPACQEKLDCLRRASQQRKRLDPSDPRIFPFDIASRKGGPAHHRRWPGSRQTGVLGDLAPTGSFRLLPGLQEQRVSLYPQG